MNQEKQNREYPECEIGYSKYKNGKPVGLVTKEECLHCKEDLRISIENEQNKNENNA